MSTASYFEIEEFLIDKAPAVACSESAMKDLKSPTATTRPSEDPYSVVFRHLFRVGLQHYAPVFVQCGVSSVAAFRSINLDSVFGSCPLLSLDLDAQCRIKLLQTEDKQYILENFASACRLQIKQRLIGAPDASIKRLLHLNLSLYILRNITTALPDLEREYKLFDDLISSLFAPCSHADQIVSPLSFMSVIRRLNLPPGAVHLFHSEYSDTADFVTAIQRRQANHLSQMFAAELSAPHQSCLLKSCFFKAFCDPESAVNSIARLKFFYPSMLQLAQSFLLFFSQFSSSKSSQVVEHHAFHFSCILSGMCSNHPHFPFRGCSYFSLNEVEAFLKASFLSFADNSQELSLDTTIDLCKTHFAFRMSEEYFEEPNAPEQPPPPPKTDVCLWLETVFPDEKRIAESLCKALRECGILRMTDFDYTSELSMEFLLSLTKQKHGHAWKLQSAFKSLKAQQMK
jgi:hypothetical protein